MLEPELRSNTCGNNNNEKLKQTVIDKHWLTHVRVIVSYKEEKVQLSLFDFSPKLNKRKTHVNLLRLLHGKQQYHTLYLVGVELREPALVLFARTLLRLGRND